jgi:glutaredoxin
VIHVGSVDRESEAARGPVQLVLYTRRACPLCDEMKHELAQAGAADRYVLRTVDVDADPALALRYGHSVPVLEIDGRVAFKGRMSAADFLRKLARASGGATPGGGAPAS